MENLNYYKKAGSKESYLKSLNSLTGIDLIKAVSRSIYKKFYPNGLRKLGIDNLSEIESIIFIFSKESKGEVSFISLFRDFIDYYRKSLRNPPYSGGEDILETLENPYLVSETLIREVREVITAYGLNVSLFDYLILNKGNAKEVFKKLGLDNYKGYRELRRIREKVFSVISYY